MPTSSSGVKHTAMARCGTSGWASRYSQAVTISATPALSSAPSRVVPSVTISSWPMRSDNSFVEDAGWHAAAERYSEFLRRHEGQKILFLELGVGYNTPVIIKYPFWRMTARNPNATYVCINKGEAVCPNEIAKQSLLFDGDIAAVLAQIK